MKVLLASFEPRRDRTSTGWRFVRKPTRHASSRQFESQPTETPGRYEPTLNARPNPPSGRSVLDPAATTRRSWGRGVTCSSIAGRPRALEGTSRAHPCCQPPAHRASPGRRAGTGRCFPLPRSRFATRRPGLDPDLGARLQSHQRHGRGRHRGRGLDRLTRVTASGSS
jgi:hypothetical protein